ncbi:CBS domain-containing protein [Vibrio sp. DW001]|jgi:CBS domain-containing protein|uniref:CBS domain-containing protein n=1 Tax=unclassified Vibrio TaxID=2614977 RepID=UPI0018A04237|nr:MULTISPECIES: CBS domain-containing protein [unclassified Vibrio]UGA55899.1 CBS domain-containing protein [Vibrio sp. VB16]WED27813.1 CBS domain-containing protein [Vibrio sp. DW001]
METLKVKDYMDNHAVKFSPEMSLSAALDKVMKSNHMGGPVVDADGKVIGFISEQDLLANLMKVAYTSQETHIVSDCMYKEVLSVSPDLGIFELAAMMKVGKPKVYPVVDKGKLLGIITRRDVLTAIGKALETSFKNQL